MPVHIVRRGDTLYGIARSHGIRYWPNVYFAAGNNRFRASHLDPNRIAPGDRVFVPPRHAIEPMERHPKIVHGDVPLFTQRAETCWRATGKMLYCRENSGPSAEADYDRLIGERYRTMAAGLPHTDWRSFYVGRLHMEEETIASPNDLHHIIASHGPAIVAVGADSSAHSMVMAGYDLFQGRWFVLDPAAGEQLTFEGDVITAGGGPSSSSSRPTRLTDYRTGPATLENMGRWLWILDTTVHQLVYYYRA
ncbi:MAG: LysM peptidoglycan-binding domain-containing protein [Gemmatimonadota bacterium]|jgi:hypothetical protein